MNQNEFLKYLEPAFTCGGGGLYFKENLKETLDNQTTLRSITKDMQDEVLGEDCWGNIEEEDWEKLKVHPIETNQDCYDFFKLYLDRRSCAFPELCGIVVGAMIKENMFDEAIEFIGFQGEELYWDS